MNDSFDKRIVVVPGFICAWYFEPNLAPKNLDEAEIANLAKRGEGWVWIHLNLTDNRCANWLTNQLGLAPSATAEFIEQTPKQYLSRHEDLLIGQLNDFRYQYDDETNDNALLRFVATDKFLLTGRSKAVQSTEHLRKWLARGATSESPLALLCQLLAYYPDRLDNLQHQLMDELEVIEDHVLDDRHRGERRRLMLARREIAQLHRHMRSLRRALATADRSIENLPPAFQTTIMRLVNLDQDFDVMESRARFFHDEIDAKLASETNRQLYILSALTAVFLPPTLVAGLFGMNLGGIPWMHSELGFWLAIGVCIVSSLAVVLYLRSLVDK